MSFRALAGIAGWAMVAGAWAQDGGPDIRYETAWYIHPEVEPRFLETRTIERGDVILKQRLLPQALALLEADIVDGDGDELAAAGEQLFGLRSSGPPIYCRLDTRTNIPMMMLFGSVGGGISQDCFVDANGDGNFDGHFDDDAGRAGLPRLTGELPDRLNPVGTAAYRTLSPTELSADHFVSIEYRGNSHWGLGRPSFRINFSYGERERHLTDETRAASRDQPQTLNLLGSRFTLARDEDGRVTVRVEEPMDSGFNVETRYEVR